MTIRYSSYAVRSDAIFLFVAVIVIVILKNAVITNLKITKVSI
jgi:hypothetical protein